MRGLWLPHLISNGMVLQQKSGARIWGKGNPKDEIKVNLNSIEYSTTVNKNGDWILGLENLEPGGPYNLKIATSSGESKLLTDIYIGDVWFMSGQSNMELPISRTIDDYPLKTLNIPNQSLRYFRVEGDFDFNNRHEDLISNGWVTPTTENVLEMSSLSFFFMDYLNSDKNIPIGVINTGLGGKPIEAFLDETQIIDDPELFNILKQYKCNDFVKSEINRSEREQSEWHNLLDLKDTGIDNKAPWSSIKLPNFFDKEIGENFCGVLWLQKEFSIPAEMINRESEIWLGTIVDSDETFINGKLVGSTGYMYPPRKYKIPKKLLKPEGNIVTVRVKCNSGDGRFTPDKEYKIFTRDGNGAPEYSLDLTGEWKYKIGYKSEPAPIYNFVNRNPTCLYNAMIHPCTNYGIKGFVWYQGESNTDKPNSYEKYLKRLITSWRDVWKLGDIPFITVQLPSFGIDIKDKNNNWAIVREAQLKSEELDNVRTVITLDLGFFNELHPTNKKEVAKRVFNVAAIMDSDKSKNDFPKVNKVIKKSKGLEIEFTNIKEIFFPESSIQIEKVQNNGTTEVANSYAKKNILYIDDINFNETKEIIYAYNNCPTEGLIMGDNNLPASPFRIKL